ncbi:MAG: hypothetical protein AMXMBFR34_14950 [Myxococcaceae bacterium]
MRSLKLLVLGATSLLSLVGCNAGQPKLYRIAIDETPIRTIANPSCFRGNILPSGRGQLSEVNYRKEDEWVIWDSLDKQYLDMGQQSWKLGDAPTIVVSDLIEGGENKIFSAQRNEVKPFPGILATESRQTQVVVTWNDYSAAPSGTIALNAQYACVAGQEQCPNPNPTPDSVSCQSNLNFFGRRIDVSQTTEYNNNP